MKKSLKMIVATMALSLSISGFASAQTTQFSDISKHWAKDTIEWGVTQGAVTGYEDGTFKPEATISEAEFLSMFLRAFGGEIAKAEGNWSDPVYAAAKALNYPVLGEKDNAIRNTPILRSQVAEIIAGANGQNYTGDAAISYLLDKGYTAGKTAATVEGYAGADSLSRAEAIQFIKTLTTRGFTKLEARPEAAKQPETAKPAAKLKFDKDSILKAVNEALKDSPAYKIDPESGDGRVTIKNGDEYVTTWVWEAYNTEWNEIGILDANNKDYVAFIIKMMQKAGVPVDGTFADTIAKVNKEVDDMKFEVGNFTYSFIYGDVLNQMSLFINEK
ncbi:S-layer homology domain-containing protein [Paenibacillus albiflavus]|uniref:S-layer homology domain-containing protein n=1 Tax=Paenibacillus albiflavus TaxID=2545760 RepID=A0A4R4E6C7_9BACL|nr:S-layer homology domain-containing protein [Paenibacillus albiflavus]TCZ73581.1 S-layer homology domain-containing protein [Paenibacillus albiflavus]